MKELFNELQGTQVAIIEEVQGREVDSWETCVSEAINNRTRKDEAQWRLGGVCAIIEKTYTADYEYIGDHTSKIQVLTIFARDVGVDPTTLRRYKSVFLANLDLCDTDINDLTVATLPPRPYEMLSFSHLSEVVSVKDVDEKRAFLDQAEDENWGVKKLRDKVRESKDEINGIQTEEYKDENEDMKFLENAFIRIDHEEKVIYCHRAYSGYQIRLITVCMTFVLYGIILV